MKPIKEINKYAIYNGGLFENTTYKNISKLVNILIEKSNEQTKAINELIKQKSDTNN